MTFTIIITGLIAVVFSIYNQIVKEGVEKLDWTRLAAWFWLWPVGLVLKINKTPEAALDDLKTLWLVVVEVLASLWALFKEQVENAAFFLFTKEDDQ